MAVESSTGWRVTGVALMVAAVIASTHELASGNLLPRRVALHALALTLGLIAIRRRARPEWSLALFGGVVGLAALTSPFRAMTVPRVLDAWAMLAIVWGISSRRVGRTIWLRGLVGLALLGSGFGLLEQWVPLGLNEASRPAGLFASRTTAGVFVAAVLPLLLGLRLARYRWAEAMALVASVTFVISTSSRAAWLGAGLASGFVLVRRKRMRWKALAVVTGIFLGLVVTPGPMLHWHADAPYVDSVMSARTALEGRLATWRAALAAIEARPLLGWGPGQFAAVAPRFTAVNEVRMEEPHNEWLRLGFEVGLLGIGAAGLAAHQLTRRRFRNPVLWSSLGVLALAACTGKTFLEPPTVVAAAVVAGLCFPVPRGQSRSVLLGAGVGVALLIAVAGVDGLQLMGSRQLMLAHRAAAEGRSRNALELAARADPFDADVALFAADLALQAGDEALCRAWVDRGLERLPDSAELRRTALACQQR